MKVSVQQITTEWAHLITEVNGLLDIHLSGVASPENATPEKIVFLSSEKFLNAALNSASPVIITSEKLAAKVREQNSSKKILIISGNPELLKAELLRKYWARTNKTLLLTSQAIHPTAVIDASAKLGEGVYVGPNVVIGANVEIGDETSIGANTVIEENCIIGQHCEFAPLVFVGHGSRIGNYCRLDSHTSLGSPGYGYAPTKDGRFHHIPQMGWIELADEVEIGANCAIDRGAMDATTIGRGTKMDNLCHIAHNCTIGQDCMITAGFRVAGSTQIGDRFKCGGGCKMAGHITITRDVTLAGGSTVTKSITEPGEYGGHPLLPMNEYLKAYANIAHLTKMRKTLSQISKKLKLDEA